MTRHIRTIITISNHNQSSSKEGYQLSRLGTSGVTGGLASSRNCGRLRMRSSHSPLHLHFCAQLASPTI